MLYKRLFFMLIALCMCCCLVSCGNDDDDNDDNNDDSLPPEGSQIGNRGYNFTLMDQNGNMISLHDFEGKVVLLDFSAMWCGPCKSEAALAEALYQRFKDQGFMIITVLISDEANNPCDQSDLQRWAATYGLTFHILSDSERVAWNLYNDEGYIPLNLVFDQRMVIHYKDVGYSESAIVSVIENLLANPPN